MLRTEGTYYARTEHGGHPVVADLNGFLVQWPSGSIRYPSARRTIMALVNRAPQPGPQDRDPKITFDRYFRRGSYRRTGPTLTLDTLTMFSPSITVEQPVPKIRTSPDLSIARAPGIDLAKRGHEVRKLFYAGFGRRVIKYGYDPDDVLQEVYKGLLVRNEGKCPFDPTKSSFGHYVHMVCGCIVSNYRRRYSRLSRNEQFGVMTVDGTMQDVSCADLAVEEAVQEDHSEMVSATRRLADLVRREAWVRDHDPVVAEKCVRLMAKGYRKSEIAAEIGEAPALVARMLRMIREVAAVWRERACL
jgi:hypothetical protein